MATHKIGNFKFNLSSRGFAYRMGEGEIHRIPFGKTKEEEYEEDYNYAQDNADYDDRNYSRDDYGSDRNYSRGRDYEDDYDERDDYAADGYDDGYDARNDYSDEEYEESSGFMRFVEEHDWVTLLLLVVFPPLGIYLLWRRNAFQTGMRYALTGLSAAWCLVLLVLIFSSLFGGTHDVTNNPGNIVAVNSTVNAPTQAQSVAPTQSLAAATASPSAAATFAIGNINPNNLLTTTTPSTTPLANNRTAAATNAPITTAGTTAVAGTVYSPASGLYYHTNRDCVRIPAGVAVSTVTVEVAEGKHQHRCPTCYNLVTYWATAGGSNYHSDKNCKGMLNAIEYTQEAAEAEGKTACTTCLPGGPTGTTQTGTVPTNTNGNVVSSIVQGINSDKSGITVYMTENGQNYHANATCRNMQGAKAVSLLTALKSGKPACATCLAKYRQKYYAREDSTWYHKDPNCQGMKGAVEIELPIALVTGKTACPVCLATATPTPKPGPTPTPRTEGGPESEDGVVYVYGTANGRYYHTYSVCEPSGMTNGARVRLSFALSQNRAPCPYCASGANDTVYTTLGGTYYHAYSTCSDMPNAAASTLARALADGYKRCPVCWEEQEKMNEAEAADQSGIYVYEIPDGRYYHTREDCNGMKGATRVKLGLALAQGKTPCPDCASFADRTVYAAVGETYYHFDRDHAAQGAAAGTLANARVYGFKPCPDCVEDEANYNARKQQANQQENGQQESGQQEQNTKPEPTSSNQFLEGRSGRMVYATKDGTYYHLSAQCAGAGADYVTLERALNYGKTPCPDCAGYARQTVYAAVSERYYHYNRDHAANGATAGQLGTALAYGFEPCPVCVEGGEGNPAATPTATPTAAPTTGPSSSGQYTEGSSNRYVYANLYGTYYHLSADCGVENDLEYVTLERALNYGKTPCPECAGYARQVVYAREGGKYYHTDANCEPGLSSGQMGTALAYGFTACPYCIRGETKPASGTAGNSGCTVFIDLNGATMLYHKNATCPGVPLDFAVDVTLQFALNWDFDPCPYCNPPASIG